MMCVQVVDKSGVHLPGNIHPQVIRRLRRAFPTRVFIE